MLDYCVEKAREATQEGRVRVYAAIVDSKGRLLAEASNSYTKSHPKQAEFARRAGLGDKIFLHAEIAALVRLRTNSAAKMYIARVDVFGNPLPARPCDICQLAIQESSIYSVEYTS